MCVLFCFLQVHESRLEVCRPVGGSSVPNGPSSPSSPPPAPSSPKAGRTGLKNRLETSNVSLTFWLSHMAGQGFNTGLAPRNPGEVCVSCQLGEAPRRCWSLGPRLPRPTLSSGGLQSELRQRVIEPGRTQLSSAGSLLNTFLVSTSLSLPGSY